MEAHSFDKSTVAITASTQRRFKQWSSRRGTRIEEDKGMQIGYLSYVIILIPVTAYFNKLIRF